MAGDGREKYYANNMRKVVDELDDAIKRITLLPDGNQRVEKLVLIRNAIDQAIKSPNGNQLAENFESIMVVINRTVPQLLNGKQLAEADEKIFESNYNRILSMLSQQGGVDRLPRLPRPGCRHSDDELKWETSEDSYTCDGCKMPGSGPRHRCQQCNFKLHPICMSSSPTSPAARHELLPNSTFKFFYKRPAKSCKDARCIDCCRRCEACAQPTEGYVYYEEGKEEDRGINFHPRCFKAPTMLVVGGVQYELCKSWTAKKCSLCNKRQPKGAVTDNLGWSYVSKGCEEEDKIDVFCAMNISLKKEKNCDLSLVMRDTKQPIEKRGIKLTKKAIRIITIVVRILIGDLSVLVDLVSLVHEMMT